MFHTSEVQLCVSTSILRVCTDVAMLITPFSAAFRVGTGPVHRLIWDAASLLSNKTALHVRPGPAGEALQTDVLNRVRGFKKKLWWK